MKWTTFMAPGRTRKFCGGAKRTEKNSGGRLASLVIRSEAVPQGFNFVLMNLFFVSCNGAKNPQVT